MVWYPADSRYSLTNHHHGGTDNHSQFSYVRREGSHGALGVS